MGAGQGAEPLHISKCSIILHNTNLGEADVS